MEKVGGKSKKAAEDTDIELCSAPIDRSVVYHLVSDIFAFLLYMHQQIPSMLQDMTLEFHLFHDEYKELEELLTQEVLNCASRRKQVARKREIKMGIKRLDKLMNTVASLQTAFQMIISEVADIEDVILILGASLRRPQHVYMMHLPCQRISSPAPENYSKKNRNAERFSRKVIRELISKGVGSSSYPGPAKMFLLVKAPASFSMPQHFLPKRDFQYNKKVPAIRLWFKQKIANQELVTTQCDSPMMHSSTLSDTTSDDRIWFQCRHVIKGLSFKNPSEED